MQIVTNDASSLGQHDLARSMPISKPDADLQDPHINVVGRSMRPVGEFLFTWHWQAGSYLMAPPPIPSPPLLVPFR